jgi:hypothetical protein
MPKCHFQYAESQIISSLPQINMVSRGNARAAPPGMSENAQHYYAAQHQCQSQTFCLDVLLLENQASQKECYDAAETPYQ